MSDTPTARDSFPEGFPERFPDHFSAVAAAYARYRPRYPRAVFDWMAALPRRLDRAWDVGTGSGQVAVELAERFAEVVATDASAAQLARAAAHPRVTYRRATAEDSGLADASVDLVTVAQALHWFDLGRFWPEVHRVLTPGGALVVGTYDLVEVTPGIDAVVRGYYRDVVGAFWPPERVLVESRYAGIAFPFREIATPSFTIELTADLAHFAGYLGTWSAAKLWSDAHAGRSPVAEVAGELAAAWGDPARQRRLRWPLSLRAGYADAGSLGP